MPPEGSSRGREAAFPGEAPGSAVGVPRASVRGALPSKRDFSSSGSSPRPAANSRRVLAVWSPRPGSSGVRMTRSWGSTLGRNSPGLATVCESASPAASSAGPGVGPRRRFRKELRAGSEGLESHSGSEPSPWSRELRLKTNWACSAEEKAGRLRPPLREEMDFSSDAAQAVPEGREASRRLKRGNRNFVIRRSSQGWPVSSLVSGVFWEAAASPRT